MRLMSRMGQMGRMGQIFLKKIVSFIRPIRLIGPIRPMTFTPPSSFKAFLSVAVIDAGLIHLLPYAALSQKLLLHDLDIAS